MVRLTHRLNPAVATSLQVLTGPPVQARAASDDNAELHHMVDKLFRAISGIAETNAVQSAQTSGVADSVSFMTTVIAGLTASSEMTHVSANKLKNLTGQFQVSHA